MRASVSCTVCMALLGALFHCGPDQARDPAPGVLVDAREWDVIDSRVDTRGLDFRFADEDDDVRIWSGEGEIPSGLAGRHAFVLADSMRTFRVQNERWGLGFELRARGTGSVVGTEIQIGIMRALDLEPGEPMRYGVEVESGERSFGDWIEVEYARLFRLEGAAGGTAAGGSS